MGWAMTAYWNTSTCIISWPKSLLFGYTMQKVVACTQTLTSGQLSSSHKFYYNNLYFSSLSMVTNYRMQGHTRLAWVKCLHTSKKWLGKRFVRLVKIISILGHCFQDLGRIQICTAKFWLEPTIECWKMEKKCIKVGLIPCFRIFW